MRNLMKNTISGLGVVVTVLALYTSVAIAETQQLVGGTSRWTQGVSPQAQKAARELFFAGNTALTQSILDEATENYIKALSHWDHPAIHYNLALALMKLDRPIEVYEHLTSAMNHGPEPLGNDKFENAIRYKDLLDKQLVWLTISCDEPGARVTLDGQVLFEGPGKHQGLVRPGMHSILAVKDGYMTSDKSRPLMPGEKVTLALRPYIPVSKTPWPAWMPWAVMGSGVAMAAGGGLLHQQTSKDYGTFDAGIRNCDNPCYPTPTPLTETRTRGDNLQKAAFGAYALGGAAIITGAILIYRNQPQLIAEDPSLKETVNIMPFLGGTTGVLTTFRF